MILLGLGSSLPYCGAAPQDVIAHAVRALEAVFGGLLISGFYASPAWPDPSDPPFINAAAVLTGSAPRPADLLDILHGVEAAFGRRRDRLNGPRTLDIDLLAYGDIIAEGRPVLPHPGLETRDFVLAPLMEIAPGYRSPRSGRTIQDLYARLDRVGAIRLSR
ncbi:MAG: 2-amino-4-hydroxy-6-hydroxymethyldihydropteridine diphosphokinase [Parvularculaceae bacterium]